MQQRIIWSNIKDGYKGFERLAVKYVQSLYDNFQHTKETRDGNKDAVFLNDEYTLVLGFMQKDNIEEWWMEAKYSETKERISRYRLDATLVSAILKGVVGRIIFVTNVNVDSQTINDVRQAITCATICKEVDFYTRDYLEYWLYQNPETLSEFFTDFDRTLSPLPKMAIVEQMSFYTCDVNKIAFRESYSILELGCSYIGHCAIYSDKHQKIDVSVESYIKGIKLITKEVILCPGINLVEIEFSLTPNYGYKSAKRADEHSLLPSPSFKFGTSSVVSKKNITVSKNVRKEYIIPSQQTALKQIRQMYHKFSQVKTTKVLYLTGISGVGKTFVLDKFITSTQMSNMLIFSCEMSNNQNNNLYDLIRCIDFLYFPYLPIDSINKEYLDNIDDRQAISSFYYKLTSCKRNFEDISHLLSKYCSEDICLFPRNIYVNRRLIIIDNFHKASTVIINALYKMITELSKIDAPYMIILSGQYVKHTAFFNELKNSIDITELELRITDTDCISLLPNKNIKNDVKHLFNSNSYFSSVIELLFFVEYILDHGEHINDFNTFTTLYHLFFRERILDLYIGRLFSNALRDDFASEELCNEVYWNSLGVDKAETVEGRKLLCNHIAKLDLSTGRLIPYHDIYTRYYRSHYANRSILDISFVEILEGDDVILFKSAIKKIHQAFHSKQFLFVYYSLEPIFRDAVPLVSTNMIERNEYYTLFYEYARSCSYCSMDYSSGNIFKRIYDETSSLVAPSKIIRKIINGSLWEVTNSTFESLEYEAAKIYAQELINNTKELISRGIIQGTVYTCVRYYNANIIYSMIKSELQESDNTTFFEQLCETLLNNGFIDRYWSFCVRYSLTLMQSNVYESIKMLDLCCAHYDKINNTFEKYYMWSKFYLSYLKMIVYDDESKEDEALFHMEQLHKYYFNDFRKTLYGMVVYFYYRGDLKRGDSLLLSDCYVFRPRRPRLQGFYHLTNALRNVITNDLTKALSDLTQACVIFEKIPSYASIIKHNICTINHYLTNDSLSKYNKPIRLDYYLGGDMEEHTYYLDIRCCW